MYDEDKAAAPKTIDGGALSSLDTQLERLTHNLDVLGERIRSVRTRYERSQSEIAVPREEPGSDLHERADSLYTMNLRLEGIIEDIVL